MNTRENIRVALSSIRSNLLRTIITCLIISIGIMALVGILTAIDGIKASINENFTSMGANSFNIRNRGSNMHMSNKGKRPPVYRYISYREASTFIGRFTFPSVVSMSMLASRGSTVKYESEKSNPNITVFGGDGNYLATAGYKLGDGRNFSQQELENGSKVAILGHEMQTSLFKTVNPLGKTITVGNSKYKVIGVMKEKGSSMGFGGDRSVILPVEAARRDFPRPDISYVITVSVPDITYIEGAIGEASGIFRNIRRLDAMDLNNFEITKSDSIAASLISNLRMVTLTASIIGLITLLGAAIGLMNIMLVSVTERTREIGTRKALGATITVIRRQFLVEAVVICQLGGAGGIILGILIGNAVSLLIGGGFIIPWLWMLTGIAICVVVGLGAGLYPAIKASKLDPIEALRAE
jgi:putative ABC transport system permease protein